MSYTDVLYLILTRISTVIAVTAGYTNRISAQTPDNSRNYVAHSVNINHPVHRSDWWKLLDPVYSEHTSLCVY